MSITYYKYRLPFVRPLQTSKKTFEHREGLIIEYSTGNYFCYGEIAPLPGYSGETLDEVINTIDESQDVIESALNTVNSVDSLEGLYKKREWPTSLQFGLDSVAYQIQAYNEKSSLSDYLFTETMDKIPVNALGSLQAETFLKDVQKKVAEGYRTIKFKVGVEFDTELKRLQSVRSEFPDLTIRLDANQAWSTETALRNFQELELLNIEYCEEPLKKATPENFELLSKHTEIPLALDECVSHVSYWPNLLPFTSYLILKPMLLGSFTKNIETKRLANTHNNKAVFTTSLESGIGRTMTAILASGLGSPKTAHGLTTGNLLAQDLNSDVSYISNGAYHLNRHHQQRIDFQRLGDVSSRLF